MEEKVLNKSKNGMAMLLLSLFLYLLAIAAMIVGGITGLSETGPQSPAGIALFIIGLIYLLTGWLLFCGLTILRPQEAVVLTLFGNYIGTLKEEGFYWVNPFCSALNPAAETKLKQSGDVDGGSSSRNLLTLSTGGQTIQTGSTSGTKKISLKIMTLNNSRQKINDCLGNPIEIGIAVMWRVTDTARRYLTWITTRNTYPSSATARLGISCGFTLMMWRKMWTPPGTGRRMKGRFAVPAR